MADAARHSFTDPNKFSSDSAVYYVAVAAAAEAPLVEADAAVAAASAASVRGGGFTRWSTSTTEWG